jgi:hypothetical protein
MQRITELPMLLQWRSKTDVAVGSHLYIYIYIYIVVLYIVELALVLSIAVILDVKQ